MTDPLRTLWQNAHADADFSAPGACAQRSGALARTVTQRNWIETLAGGFVGVIALAMSAGALVAGLWDFALAGAALVVGIAVMLVHLHRHGRSEPAPLEASCRAHYRAQLTRQRDLLHAAWRWYILPLVPGTLLFIGTVALRMAGEIGTVAALRGVAVPLASVILMFGFIAWLNRRAAAGLDATIDAVDALA